MEIYADNAATTKISKEALNTLKETTVYAPVGEWSKNGQRYSFNATKLGTRYKSPSTSFSVSGKYNGSNVNSTVAFKLYDSLNLTDVYEDHVRVLGKGNKERVVYFGEGCREALDDYLMVRDNGKIHPDARNALFISQKNGRFGARGIEQMLEKKLLEAGMDASRYSPHKLRHTAATLMLKNGVDTRALQEVLGHANLSTTQIYTHIDNAALHEAAMANPIGRKIREKQTEE